MKTNFQLLFSLVSAMMSALVAGRWRRGDGAQFQQPNSIFDIMEKWTAQKTLSLKPKIDFIKEVEDNPWKLRETIADEFGIPCSTLYTMNLAFPAVLCVPSWCWWIWPSLQCFVCHLDVDCLLRMIITLQSRHPAIWVWYICSIRASTDTIWCL